ncbi:MAG: hypothetical protein ANABAC_2697 [Anaerolineae bacterium]|nr:MAG: hypothetical protein ANABAC_2697 [Anaerolineae bacterium]
MLALFGDLLWYHATLDQLQAKRIRDSLMTRQSLVEGSSLPEQILYLT